VASTDVAHRHWCERRQEVAFVAVGSGSSSRLDEAPASPTSAADLQLSFGELYERARSVASALCARSASGEPVLLFFSSELDFIIAFFACLFARAYAVPLAVPAQAVAGHVLPRLEPQARDAGARLLLTSRAALHLKERAEAVAPSLASVDWIAIDDLDTRGGALDTLPRAKAGDIALLQYTSGSTEQPKGVIVTHGNLVRNAEAISRLRVAGPTVTWLPFFHDMGLMGGLLQPFYEGCPCYLMKPEAFLRRPVRWLKAITRYRATASVAPCFGYELCVERITDRELEGVDLSSLNVAMNGAEPVRADVVDRFISRFSAYGFRPSAMIPCYGLAEATLFVSGGRASDLPDSLALSRAALDAGKLESPASPADAHTVVSCGSVATGVEVCILGERGEPLGERQIGEILVSGPTVAQGYWRRPRETEATFNQPVQGSPKRFLRTGDLGFLADGRLFITGRVKDLVIVDGRNIYLHDVEATIARALELPSPSVIAFALSEARGEMIGVAIEAPKAREAGGVDALARAARRAVSERYGVAIEQLSLVRRGALPRTSSGKLQRQRCRRDLESGLIAVVAESHLSAPPSTRAPSADAPPKRQEIARRLREALAQILHGSAEAIDANAPFAELGLTSRGAVELAGSIERWLGQSVESTLAYEHPTIERLSTHLARSTATLEVEAAPKAALAPTPEHSDRDVAIVGMACRLPGAADVAGLWQILSEGRTTTSGIPAARSSLRALASGHNGAQIWGAFLSDVETFDAAWFGISHREAAQMDPQQRLLMQVAVEALEDAGIISAELAGSNTGVWVGITSYDFALLNGQRAEVSAYTATGGALCIAANRISYSLDLRGPSLAVDTACSSSLVALHLACQSVRSGETRLALVGGVNLLLSTVPFVNFLEAGVLSPDGRCKTFDASADGFVRGEGALVLVLKRLSQALADGDRIYGCVRGSAVNQDGSSNGLMAPNGAAQEAVIRAACADAGVAPSELRYVEAHGTGTKLGDAIELRALGRVVGNGRRSDSLCAIGSVKTNFGHLEAAAGVLGVAKAALSLHYRMLPASLHFRQASEGQNLAEMGLEIQASASRWGDDALRCFGVSSFGFGGTNAHAVLVSPPPQKADDHDASGGSTPELFVLSAKHPDVLRAHARRMSDELRTSRVSLADFCGAAATRRDHREHRLAIVASNAQELAEVLASFAGPSLMTGQGKSRRAALVFEEPRYGWLTDAWRLVCDTPVNDPGGKVVEAARSWCRARASGSPEAVVSTDLGERPELWLPLAVACQVAFAERLTAAGVPVEAASGRGAGAISREVFARQITLEAGLAKAQALAPLRKDDVPVSPETAVTEEDSVVLVIGGEARTRSAQSTQPWIELLVALPAQSWLPRTLAELYVAGCELDFRRFFGGKRRHVDLPTSPWNGERYPVLAPAQHAAEPELGLSGRRFTTSSCPDGEFVQFTISRALYPELADHRLRGNVWLPATWFLAALVAACAEPAVEFLAFEDVAFERPLLLELRPVTLEVAVQNESDGQKVVAISSRTGSATRWTRHVRARLPPPSSALGMYPESREARHEIQSRCRVRMSSDDVYADLAARGLAYGPAFRRVASVSRRERESLGEISGVASSSFAWGLDPTALDACLHVLACAAPKDATQVTRVPARIARFSARPSERGPWLAHCELMPESGGALEADVTVSDGRALPIAEFVGLELAELGDNDSTLEPLPFAYERSWVPKPLTPRAPSRRSGASEPPLLEAKARSQILFLLAANHAELKERATALLAALRRGEPASVPIGDGPARFAAAHDSVAELAWQLEAFLLGERAPGVAWGIPEKRPRLVFVCGGQGSQWVGMGRTLAQAEPEFAASLARLDAALARHAPFSLLQEIAEDEARSRLTELVVIQPSIFALQVAHAELFASWGVQPDIVLGHSMGEIAAAHIAQMLDLADAARVVCERARLVHERASGKGRMAAIDVAAGALQPFLAEEPAISIAAYNGPAQTIVAGEIEAMDRLLERLQAEEIGTHVIRVDYASHSSQMDGLRTPLVQALQGIEARTGRCPLLSTVTLEYLRGEELGPEYWARNIREPVRFAQAVAELARFAVFVELSPHPVLSAPIEAQARAMGVETKVFASARRAEQGRRPLLESLAELFANGVELDVSRVLAALNVAQSSAGLGSTTASGEWLLVSDPGELGDGIQTRLERRGYAVRRMPLAHSTAIGPAGTHPLEPAGSKLCGIVLVPETANDPDPTSLEVDRQGAASVLLELAKRTLAGSAEAPISIVTERAHWLVGDEHPPDAALGPLIGLSRAIALEHPQLVCRRIDVDARGERLALACEQIVHELCVGDGEPEVAYRDMRRLVPRLRARQIEAQGALRVRPDGTYLITGGTGAVGMQVVAWLARRGARSIALVARRPAGEAAAARITELSSAGVRVCVYQADVGDAEQVREVLKRERERAAPLRGVIHAAGVLDDTPCAGLDATRLAAVLAPKAGGAAALDRLTAEDPLDFFVLCSSAATAMGSPGQAAYVAANSYLDALAAQRHARGACALSVGWGPWSGAGLAQGRALTTAPAKAGGSMAGLAGLTLSSGQAIAGLEVLLVQRAPQALIVPYGPEHLRAAPAAIRDNPLLHELVQAGANERAGRRYKARPALTTPFAEPRNEIERRIADIWAEVLECGPLGCEDSFIALGGDSILSTQITARIRREFGVVIAPQEALSQFTVAGLARIVAASLGARAPASPAASPASPR